MMSSDVTQGERAPDNARWYGEDSPVHNGSYGRVMVDDEWEWRCRTPNGTGGRLGVHEVVEHEDGTITVSPSILCDPRGDHPGWHGYLENGVWREV